MQLINLFYVHHVTLFMTADIIQELSIQSKGIVPWVISKFCLLRSLTIDIVLYYIYLNSGRFFDRKRHEELDN